MSVGARPSCVWLGRMGERCNPAAQLCRPFLACHMIPEHDSGWTIPLHVSVRLDTPKGAHGDYCATMRWVVVPSLGSSFALTCYISALSYLRT